MALNKKSINAGTKAFIMPFAKENRFGSRRPVDLTLPISPASPAWGIWNTKTKKLAGVYYPDLFGSEMAARSQAVGLHEQAVQVLVVPDLSSIEKKPKKGGKQP